MNKNELIKLIDTTKCTACRGCQVACKQWNEMPGLRTKNWGSYQNPPELGWNTWTLIPFSGVCRHQGNIKVVVQKRRVHALHPTRLA